MFGKPTSRFSNLTEGKEHYIKGNVTPDSYILQNEVKINDGRVRIQIKEIEPEKSSIDFVTLDSVCLAGEQMIFTKSDFSGEIVTTRSKMVMDLERSHIVIRSSVPGDYVELASNYLQSSKRSVTLNDGDWLEVEFTRSDNESAQYLLLDSWFRDWMLGELYLKDRFIYPVGYWIKFFSAATVSAFIAFVGFFNPLASHRTNQQGNDLLLGAYGPYHAHAEVPTSSSGSSGRSLIISSFNKHNTTIDRLEVVEPRYVKPDTVAIEVPDTAYDEAGNARLRIEATKRHKISGVGIISAQQQLENTPVARVSLPLVKATLDRTGEEYADILAMKRNGKYVDTLPGDILSLEFDASAIENSENSRFILSVGGVYSYANENDQYLAGDWVDRLDTTAKQFLKETYIQSQMRDVTKI